MNAARARGHKLMWACGATLLLLTYLQVRALTADYTNPPVESELAVETSGFLPPEVGAILNRACKDCHSFETRWPWYSRVTVISQLLDYDVDRARRMLNLSRYNVYKPRRARVWMDSACSAVTTGRMPLPRYRWMHEEARLSGEDIRALCNWANSESERLGGREETSPAESKETPIAR